MTSETDGWTSKRGRSPSYPATPLDVAIDRAQMLYKQERRNYAPVAAIHAHWGFKPNSGPASLALAALKKYGLIEDEGSGIKRVARLTDLAREIILNPEPAEAIRHAALMPPIHRELWEHYQGNLPSDATLRHELEQNRNFTERGATEFISQYRKTVKFAQLDEAVSESGATVEQASEEPSSGDDHMQTMPQAAPRVVASGSVGGMVIPIPLRGSATPVQIVGNFPVSEAAWQQLLRVLDAMKPGLVQESDDERDAGPS